MPGEKRPPGDEATSLAGCRTMGHALALYCILQVSVLLELRGDRAIVGLVGHRGLF